VGPVRVDLCFYFARPKSHFRTGKFAGVLRDDAPKWHTTKPDRDNLEKAVLDALTQVGGFWQDDSQVCAGSVTKRYGIPCGMLVSIKDFMSTPIIPSPVAILAAWEIGQTCVVADGDHEPFVSFDSEACARIIERAIAAEQVKNAALETQLEAHAWTVSPAMARAQIDALVAKVAELEQDKARLDWLESEENRTLLAFTLYASQTYREGIDAARKEGQS
jgi:hypothetical protein